MLGIGLGVAVLVAVVIVNDSVVRGVSATVDEIAGKTDLQISAGSSGFSEDLLAQTRATPGVYQAAPVVQQTVTIRDPKARGERLLVLGIDMLEDQDSFFRSYGSNELSAIRNDPLAFLNSPQNILISRAVAQRFGYKLHDKIALATGVGVLEFDIWGFLDDLGVGRAFGGAVAVMYYQAMQISFDRGQNIDRIDLAVTPGSEIAAVEKRLQHTLGGGFIIERPSRKGDRVNKMLLGVRSGLTIASLLALLVGAFLIHNTMAISVVQRKREIGILRALGSTQREVITLLTLEGGLLGAVGSLLGIGIGIGLVARAVERHEPRTESDLLAASGDRSAGRPESPRGRLCAGDTRSDAGFRAACAPRRQEQASRNTAHGQRDEPNPVSQPAELERSVRALAGGRFRTRCCACHRSGSCHSERSPPRSLCSQLQRCSCPGWFSSRSARCDQSSTAGSASRLDSRTKICRAISAARRPPRAR